MKIDKDKVIRVTRHWEFSFKHAFVSDIINFSGLSKGACVDIVLKVWNTEEIDAITKVNRRWKERLKYEKGYAIQTINNCLSSLLKANILISSKRGSYSINPEIFKDVTSDNVALVIEYHKIRRVK